MSVVGRDDFNVLKSWSEQYPDTYLGIMAAGVPNNFMLLGPNTVGNNT